MNQWLTDTFVWTGCLIALVLLLRRPVARHFGPQVAYALWALPLVRFLLPPLVLPASFAPVEAPAEPLQALATTADMPPAHSMLVLAADVAPVAPPEPAFDWSLVLLAVWLLGAIAFLGWRTRQYLAMRADLLADARPVGEVGKVRLVETPAVTAPVAFGVRDKVVALPLLFMAQPDRAARDLAIAHELAHHRGHDLIANIAAQPLLALHWFNPLAWAGWRAMRRDQEAACDARVVAGREQDEKATYARVIASFATGRHLALAAPMACPMAASLLGEKSIIHRLRSLTMSDVSESRRQLGLAAIAGTALVALPLTASVSYAQADAPDAPEAPDTADAPDAPDSVASERTSEDGSTHVIRIERRDAADGGGNEAPMARHFVLRRNGEELVTDGHAPDGRAFAWAMGDGEDFDIDIDLSELEGIDEEVAQAMAEARAEMAEAQAEMAEQRSAMAHSRIAMAEAREQMPRFEMNCSGDQQVQQRTDAQGRRVTVICRQQVRNNASMGLRQAQNAIRNAEGMPEDQRDRIINELQEQIERMEREEVSYVAPIAPVAPVMPVAKVASITPVAGGFRVTFKPVEGFAVVAVPGVEVRAASYRQPVAFVAPAAS